MPGIPFDGLPASSSPPHAGRRSEATSSSDSAIEELEELPDAEDHEEPVRPQSIDVYMLFVNVSHFNHLTYATITQQHNAPTDNIRDTLVAQGGNAHVTLAPSYYGAMLLMFDVHAWHEAAINAPPFVGQHHTIILERQEDMPNRFHFEHEAIVSIAIRNYPLEPWNRERMFYTIGPFANPHSVDLCLQGVDFSVVLMQVKAEDATDIPLEEYLKNHSGIGAYVRVSITDIGALDEDSDSGDFGPCSPDSGNAAQLGGALGLSDAPGPHGALPAPAPSTADGPAPAQPGGPGAFGPP
jgi:hypothetical protein